MKASILSLATAVPPYTISQREIVAKMIDILSLDPERAQRVKHLYENSAINTRYTVISDFFSNDRADWKFWGDEFPAKVPGTRQRNEVYKIEAPKLAREAAAKALKAWGGDSKEISHVISVSCTGMIAPGIEFDLMRSLNLKPSVDRLAINFMGCFGAFKGLAVAQSIAKENPKHRVLLVCTELCSLHLQTELTPDNILGNSLFSDGAAAVIVGADAKEGETSLWTIDNRATFAVEDTPEKMTWEIGDNGFVMKLSHTVPVLLGRQIGAFVQSLVDSHFSPAECDFAIHPGGKSIVQAIEKALKLEEGMTRASWDTLADYGNMSSATFLFVLNRLQEQKSTKRWTLGLGFGPGLSLEGILLSRAS